MREKALIKTSSVRSIMTALALARLLTAARPLSLPPIAAGATSAASPPHCWTRPPRTALSNQTRTLQEYISVTTLFFCFFVFTTNSHLWNLRIDIVLRVVSIFHLHIPCELKCTNIYVLIFKPKSCFKWLQWILSSFTNVGSGTC